MKRKVAELQREARRMMNSSVRGYETEGHMTRRNYKSVLPFTVNQGDEPTCAFVTMAKVLLFNLMGLVMDIRFTEREQEKITTLVTLFPIRSDTSITDRQLKDAGITPSSCSPKGFALIVLFFYFYDWLKDHDMRGYYFEGDTLMMKTRDGHDYNDKLVELFQFLKLTKKRLGGHTFTADGWIQEITRHVSPHVSGLTWKKISVCTLNTPFTDADTFSQYAFEQLSEVIFRITRKFKITLTLHRVEPPMHDVMIVGIEGNKLILSNSWGTFLNITPLSVLPRIALGKSLWNACQFTFLLPMFEPIDFQTQYELDNFHEFLGLMQHYYPQMDALDAIPKLDPAVLDALAASPRAEIGGTRKRYTRKHFRNLL